jgi:ribosomal protein L16 Arg81 hydroxylase
VRGLAEACQQALRAHAVVNLYAGWRTEKGLDLHWDPQENMMLQISGRKHWKVYAPTRPHPLRVDVAAAPKPTQAPVWEGILQDGDMIYVPRGWWHVAVPVDEPSLHLTVTLMPAAGDDLLEWFVSRLKRHDEMRMNVPRLLGEAARAQHAARVRELLLQAWDDGALEQFLAEWDSNLPVRPGIRLPLAPAASRQPIAMETRIRLAANRELVLVSSPQGAVFFHANGVRWECAAELAPALALLRDGESRSFAQLGETLPGPAERARLAGFLTALAMGGAVWLER